MSISTFINDLFTGQAEKDAQQGESDWEKFIDQMSYSPAGDFTPEQWKESMVANISEDPATRNAQMKALNEMQGIVDAKGLTAEDKARMNQINQQAAQQERGQRNAIMQNAQSRGTSGSGFEAMQQLMNQQEGANQRSTQGLNVQAQAQQRAMDAVQNLGQMGGAVRSQDFGVANTKASAQDALNRFNIENKNAANLGNLDRRQSLLTRTQDARFGGKGDIYKGRVANANARDARTDNFITSAATGFISGNPVGSLTNWWSQKNKEDDKKKAAL